MLSKSNLFLASLLVVLLFRWQFFGDYLLLDESVTIFQPAQDYLVSLCKQIMPEPQSSLLSGILIGQKQDLDSNFKKALTNTSTIHIVVVSGQNLSMLAGFVLAFAPFLGRKKTVLATIAVVCLYSVLTGLQVPVVRAAFMSLFSLIGMLFNREVNGVKILSFSFLLMLLINPSWLTSISFQLSFLATAGVMVVAPEITKFDHFTPDFIKPDAWVSISAQALTLPVIAINFHRISLIGVVTNLFVLWTVAPVMLGGIIALIGAIFWPSLGQLLGLLPSLLLLYFVDVINLSNGQWGSVVVRDYPSFFWVGYYLMFIGLYLLIKAKNRKTQSKIYNRPRVLTT